MSNYEDLETELKKRDAALERVCDELWSAEAFGRSPESSTILAAVRSAYDSEPSNTL